MQPDLPSQLLSYANKALAAGRLAAAEIACRELLDLEPRDAAAWHLLGYIAAQAGMRDVSVGYFQRALEIEPDNDRIRENLLAVQSKPGPQPPRGDRYLLIKGWGFGFWADMAHVLGSLLLAEITGRVPVVHWGPESPISLEQLAHEASFFPPRWNAGNLKQSGISKWEGKGSRAGAVFFLNRPETVAVSDFHIGVVNAMPWIPPSHPMHGKPLQEIYLYLTEKYLRPRPDIVAACDTFIETHLAGRPFIALHMRGSDKAMEDPELEATNRALLDALDEADPSWPVFLLTDDAQCLARMKSAYGPRIIAADCQRTQTAEGVHYLPAVDPVRAGREVLIDTWLALRADCFVGNGRSNVAAMIAVLKDWAPGACSLLGRSILTERNLHIYRIPVSADPKDGS